MALRKLTSTNAFVVTDLADAPSVGIVRSAPKILQGGAGDLARSLTYTFASFEMQYSGASAGINATPDERDDAIAAFATELADDIASGSLSFDAGKGVGAEQYGGSALGQNDQRSAMRLESVDDNGSLADHLAGLGPAVAAEHAVGLDGRTVAIEGAAGSHTAALAAAIEARGAKIISLSIDGGSRTDPAGISAADIAAGAGVLGDEPEAAWKVFQSGADVLFAGSKMGAVNHTTAEKLSIAALVPHQPIPFTTRALAILQRSGAVVVPDFLAVAGPAFSWWPADGATPDTIIEGASSAIAAAIDETKGHDDGGFLGACYRAEAFLRTWRDELPFGRPLAS